MGRVYENHPGNESIHLGGPRDSSERRTLETSEDLPEVFTLQPLTRRRVTARIRKRGPARFHFVADGD